MLNILIKGVTIDTRKLKRQSEKVFKKALDKTALQWLNWCNTGSPAANDTPPIKWGVLRASASVFVGKDKVGVAKETASKGQPTPLQNYNGKEDVITIVYNTDYAFKMHEERGEDGTWKNLGDASKRAKNATDKWLEKHIANDGKLLYAMIARLVKKALGV